MVLDSTTFEKVGQLLRIPRNTIEYHGAYGSKVDFFIGIKNETNDYQCGCFIRVTQDFRLDSVRRIRVSEGRFTRNWPIRGRVLPLYIPGL